ncbi:DEAD/DEAH box helicase [Neorhizobium galegae]|uniref:DEAD/DEAH box helicase n=1 Tax=Neorhizobium galegae TaxID=399 RepID=UPI0021009ADE|nr:DEAD/DEAH box helicase [Neorhizobium galegae]MCQ1571732.1 DEAD/DEAH box helicase [Neorhizobium galegae]
MKLPDNYIAAENSSAAMLRGQNLAPFSVGEMLAIAQNVMGAYQGASIMEQSEALHDEDGARPLIAAARILEVIGHNQTSRGVESDIIRRTQLLAALAYGMAGNLPSAAAIVRRIQLDELVSDAEVVSVAVSSPASIPRLLAGEAVRGSLRSFLEHLAYVLYSGDPTYEKQLMPQLSDLIAKAAGPFNTALLVNSRLVLKHVIDLSVARTLLRSSSFMRAFGEALYHHGRPCFLPPQKQILENGNFGQSLANAIVTVPTSGGKTLLAEFAIARALEAGPGLAIYVVPYIALGNQVFDTLVRHFGKLARVHAFFGGFKADAYLDPRNHREIVVATPERLDALLRSGSFYSSLRVAVFDEAHIIENGVRGTRIEALITRLRLQQNVGAKFRIILLSAVLSNVDAICHWLGNGTINVNNNWRPTARRVAIWRNTGRLAWIYANDTLRPDARQPNDTLVEQVLPWPKTMYATDVFREVRAQLPAAFMNVAYLARFMWQLLGGPILIVCATKANTRGLAKTLAASIPPHAVQPQCIIDIIELIEREHKHLSALSNLLQRGVTYHNASLPMGVRKLIEEAIRQRKITYVSATTTLAEGVDLPFRTTILFDWLSGFKDKQVPMPSLLFRNIAGRCGRAGEFVEGDTVIFDNLLGALRYTHEAVRGEAQSQLLTAPPPLTSTIGNDNLPQHEREAIKATISSQLMAVIPEHPSVDNIDQHFAISSYAHFTGGDASSALREARNELLDSSRGEPFALAASPMWLTPKGLAANATGLSAATVNELVAFLARLPAQLNIDMLSLELIRTVGFLPEQGNLTLSELAAGTLKRSYLDLNEWADLSSKWRARVRYEDMFIEMRKAQKSTSAVHPRTWVEGQSENDYVEAQYDKFVEVVEYGFGVFLPWMLRACSYLAPLSGNAHAVGRDWMGEAAAYETARHADLEAVDVNIDNQV